MKRFIVVVVLALVLCANFAFAEDPINIDINIDNENNITATGGDATAEQQQNQEQNQHQIMNFNERVQLPHLQYGTNFINPGITIGGEKWKYYCPADKKTLRKDQVGRARTRLGFWASLNPFNWGESDDLVITYVNERLTGDPQSITCLNFWPEEVIGTADSVVLEVTGYGKTRQNLTSLQADVANICMSEAGTPFYTMMIGSEVDGVTSGNSISIGGATSAVTHNGNRGVVVTGGGQIGTVKTTQVERYKIWAKCISQGYEPPRSAPLEKKVTPPPAPACNPSEYLKKIEEAEDAIFDCKRYSYHNMVEQLKAGENSVKAWICTKEARYLHKAIQHYQMAELNYIHGHDIKKHADSAQVIDDVEYGLASAFYARDGHIKNYLKAPTVVTHQNKKTKKAVSVATTKYERREVMKIRNSLERYSKDLVL